MTSRPRSLSPLLLFVALAVCTPAARAITYADWVASYGLSGAAAAPDADPDGDGKPNLIEYALAGCNPTVQDPAAGRVTFVFGTRSGDALPANDPTVITFAATVGPTVARHVGLRYTPRPGVEGIRYLVEYCDPRGELGRWFSGRSAVVTRTDHPVAGDHIGWVLALFSPADFTRVFLRLRIQFIDSP